MLHILLMILKIIGITLLALLGLLILLILIVLLVPLKYQISVGTKGDLETTKLAVKFSWLLHLVAGKVTYEEKELNWNIRVAWKNITQTSSDEESSEINLDEETDSEDIVEEKMESSVEEKKEDVKEAVEEDFEKEIENELDNDLKDEPDVSAEEDKKFQKIKCTIHNVCDKIKLVWEFLNQAEHKAAFSKVMKELGRLLKFLKPKKLNGKIHFGMEDPCTTGQILAVLSVLYPVYGDSFEIYPDFDEKVLDGDVFAKGHIRVVYAVIVAFNMIINKNVRTTLGDIKQLF